MLDVQELRELCTDGCESDVCEYVANLEWDDLQASYAVIADYGITENDVMRWIYINLK
jgi:hypothetical protein